MKRATLATIILSLSILAQLWPNSFAQTLPMTIQPCGDDQHGDLGCGGGGGNPSPTVTPTPTPTPEPANDSRYYDANGNLAIANGLFYEYNGFNQLARVRNETFQGPIIEEYLYDENGGRIAKIEPQNNQTTYYPSDDYTEVVNDSGTFPTKYYYENGILIARKDHTNTTYYYHPDHLGSTDLITDQNGQVVEETIYEPFGAALQGAGDASGRYTYTGKEQDQGTGLYYYSARYYDSRIGQFVQPDPVTNYFQPQNLNRFAYVLNNPYKYTDPDGKIAWLAPFAVGGAIGGGISIVTQLYNTGTVNWGDVGKSAFIGASGAAAGTLAAGVGVAAFGSSALASIGVGAGSGVAAGQAATVVDNALNGQPLTQGTLNTNQMAGDALLGGISSGLTFSPTSNTVLTDLNIGTIDNIPLSTETGGYALSKHAAKALAKEGREISSSEISNTIDKGISKTGSGITIFRNTNTRTNVITNAYTKLVITVYKSKNELKVQSSNAAKNVKK